MVGDPEGAPRMWLSGRVGTQTVRTSDPRRIAPALVQELLTLAESPLD